MLRVYKKLLFYIFSGFLVFIAIIPLATYVYFAKDLVNQDAVMNRNNTGVTLLDRNGRPFFTLFEAKNKVFVQLSNIPLFAQHAIVASEDKDFYTHPGFSIRAIARSLYLDIKAGKMAYGGSTITQQLVKNVLLNSNKSFLRKYQELVLAQEIERRYRKSKILEMYLNSVYFGEGAFGIEEAARTYFGKSAKDLTLAEASYLVALVQAPSQYSPYNEGLKKGLERQHAILQKMEDQQYIISSEKIAAENQKLQFGKQEPTLNTTAIHFALMIKDKLIQQFGEEEIARSGFTVRTTLDLDWQKYAEEVVSNQVDNLRTSGVTNGAAVVINPKTGEVRVLVGSKDWYNEQFGKINMAISPRQPGSSFKPIIYSAAFEEGLITPLTILHDSPITYSGNYSPRDYDGKFRGSVTVRRALANSLNIPAVEVMSKVGVSDAVSMANRFGITTLNDPSNYGLSLVLGAGEVKLLEQTNVYATFANEGVRNDIATILEIRDKYDNPIYQNHPVSYKVIDPSVAFLVTSILSDNKARAEAFGDILTISRPAAVKTGTSEDYRDSLTLGYTPSLTVGAWVGNNDRAPMNQIAGSIGAAPIWKTLMEHFLAGTPIEQFSQPATVVKAFSCNASSSASFEYFISGTQPIFMCLSPMPSFTLTPSPTLAPSSPMSPTPTLKPTVTITPTPALTPISTFTIAPFPTLTPSQAQKQTFNFKQMFKKENN